MLKIGIQGRRSHGSLPSSSDIVLHGKFTLKVSYLQSNHQYICVYMSANLITMLLPRDYSGTVLLPHIDPLYF